jgi:hypothetical protein
MRRARITLRASAAFAIALAFVAGCTAIIGTPDLFFVDAAAGEDGGNEGGSAISPDGQADSAITCANTQTDPSNCGRCGRSCLGGACDGGVCSPVRINGDAGVEPWAIAVDDGFVYYTAIGGPTGVLYKVPKDGAAAATTLATTVSPLIYDLKLDATHAYFSSGSYGNGGAVERVPLAGGSKQQVARNPDAGNAPRGVTLSAQNVYWVNTFTPGEVKTSSKTAIAPTTIASNETDSTLALVDSNVLWWTRKTAGILRRCTLPACSDRYDLTTGLTEPDAMGENALRVFYNSGNTVMQIAKNALLGPGAVVASNQSLPVAFAADDRELYWIDLGDYQQSWADGTIRRCPVVNGAAVCTSTPKAEGEIIASPGAFLARGIAIDATAVYWTEQQAHAVYRLAR